MGKSPQRFRVQGLETERPGSYSGSATLISCVILGKLLKLLCLNFHIYEEMGVKTVLTAEVDRRVK